MLDEYQRNTGKGFCANGNVVTQRQFKQSATRG